MTVRNRIQPGDGDPRHGTANGYSNLDCRCAGCRAAWAASVRRRKAQRLIERDASTLSHGRASTYFNWGCRCEDCREAKRAYDRRRNRRAAS